MAVQYQPIGQTEIKMKEDSKYSSISKDPRNRDYQTYMAWSAGGGYTYPPGVVVIDIFGIDVYVGFI